VFINSLESSDPSAIHKTPLKMITRMISNPTILPLSVAAIKSGYNVIPFVDVKSNTDPSVVLRRLQTVSLRSRTNVARDLTSAYELLTKTDIPIDQQSVVLFVSQKPKPNDLEMVSNLRGLGLKLTIVGLGNEPDMRGWLNAGGTISLPDSKKPGGDNDDDDDGEDILNIIDEIIDASKPGIVSVSFFLSNSVQHYLRDPPFFIHTPIAPPLSWCT